jgi:hypothetical protein
MFFFFSFKRTETRRMMIKPFRARSKSIRGEKYSVFKKYRKNVTIFFLLQRQPYAMVEKHNHEKLACM